jgi:hypothetical protein
MRTRAHYDYIFRSIPALPSTSSSDPIVEQWTSLTNDRYVLHHGHNGQDPLRYTAQSFLECLDRYDRPGRLVNAYKGIIRICLEEILANCQSEAVNEGSQRYNDIDNRAISEIMPQTPFTFNAVIPLVSQSSVLQHLQAQEHDLLSQESRGFTSNLPEGTDPPLDQLFPSRVGYIHVLSFSYHTQLDFFGTFGSVSYELGAQSFHSSAPQQVTCPEGQTLSNPTMTTTQESHPPIGQGVQEKVKCTWAGCSSVVRKDSYTRHVRETHRREAKAVCAHCEKAFPRTYMKRNHELTCRGQSSQSKRF